MAYMEAEIRPCSAPDYVILIVHKVHPLKRPKRGYHPALQVQTPRDVAERITKDMNRRLPHVEREYRNCVRQRTYNFAQFNEELRKFRWFLHQNRGKWHTVTDDSLTQAIVYQSEGLACERNEHGQVRTLDDWKPEPYELL